MTGPSPWRLIRHAPMAACAAGAVIAAVGCSGSASTVTPFSKGSSSGPFEVAQALVTADALVYSNRYTQADSAFRGLTRAHPDSALAHTEYALFLAYRGDLAQARTEADGAVVLAPELARARAVLCRIEDWTNHLADAVAEGRRAVQLDGREVLAHLFLGEALADTGDLDGGRRALTDAGSLIDDASPAYLRAELHREQGNLAHDAGDLAAELQAFTAAFQAQPGWVERPEELAGAYVDNHDLVGARNAIQKALDLTPGDPPLLAQLGRVAMLEPDYATADAALTKLVDLQPRSSTVLELAAHARFAHRADLDGAVGLLQRAVAADPSNEEAAAYLVYLERDVRNDQARGLQEVADATAASRDDAGPAARARPGSDIAAVQAAHAQRALVEINAARAAAGLDAVTLDDHLSVSALTHCYYWLFNNNSPTVAKLGIHLENPDLPGFSGVRPGDRDVNFGWHGGPVGEDITHTGDAVLAVGQWVNSVYHRFPIMAPDLSAIGYGDCAAGPVAMEDMEFGFGIIETSPHAPVFFPGDRQQSVPAMFSDNELPDPVPTGRPRTTGYPVTVTFDSSLRVSIDSFSLQAPSGTSVPAYQLAPDPLDGNTATLLPAAPLRAHTRYTARITARVNGQRYEHSWSFVTA